MASIRAIIRGMYRGFWSFCFPENNRREQLRQIEYANKKDRLEWYAYHSTQMGISSHSIAPEPIIVSLTTHGKRIRTVHLTIESLLQQTLPPNKILLYLGDAEFSNASQLPIVLQRMINRGLEVRFVPDQRSYTKLLPALQEFPNSSIITVDDDLLYPYDLVERLVNAHNATPTAICCLASLTMKFIGASQLADFKEFCYEIPSYQDKISPYFLPEGFAGVLYPPHSLSHTVFDSELFLHLSPTADDLWFRSMSLLKGTPVLRIHNSFDLWHDLYRNEAVQDIALSHENVDANGNDRQLRALFDHFNLYQFFR